MSVPTRPLVDITEEATRLLVRELGPADAARFLGQFSTGSGDYTADRDRLFDGLTIRDVVDWDETRAGESPSSTPPSPEA